MTIIDPLELEGYLAREGVFSPSACASLLSALPTTAERRGGVRHLLRQPAVRGFLDHPPLIEWLRAILGADAFAYRATLFDKTPGANWKVPWHQDLAVPLAERHDQPGWSGWSVKDGVLFAQPPAEFLARALAVRIHLDPCGADNGPLRVLTGTHREGRIPESDIAARARDVPERSCLLGCGGVLFMRPLLLHASSPATSPAHRRVLHVEYGPADCEQGFRLARE